jgi:precorrin-6B methylase 2
MRYLSVLYSFFIAFLCLPILQGNSNELLKELYKEKSGYCINDNECASIKKSGGDDTYGEITDEAVQIIINELKPTADDVFYDLGSGIGRMTFKMYLDSPIKKAIGVELSPTRHANAMHIKCELEKRGKIDKGRILEFRNEDMMKTSIEDATIIYLASTCLSNDFMKKITNRLAGLKKGLRVLSLRKLPSRAFRKIKTLKLKMTWSDSVPVHWYELKKN